MGSFFESRTTGVFWLSVAAGVESLGVAVAVAEGVDGGADERPSTEVQPQSRVNAQTAEQRMAVRRILLIIGGFGATAGDDIR